MDAHDVLRGVHDRLRLVHGSLTEELTEQLLIAAFLPRDACVLELGGNVGRASCVINCLLDYPSKHVVMEVDPRAAAQLRENRDANGLAFRVEAAALGARPRVVQECDDSIGRRSAVAGEQAGDLAWKPAANVPWPELCARYPNFHFDALVADCEGALPAICDEYPGFLSGFRTVIVESDYDSDDAKRDMDRRFAAEGLRRVACIPSSAAPKTLREAEFYEVWRA